MEAILLRATRKYLDIFLKDFGRQDINISLFSGGAVLQNLDLNEDVLTELIGLPCLRVTRAFVNRAKAKASITGLKSTPVKIMVREPAQVICSGVGATCCFIHSDRIWLRLLNRSLTCVAVVLPSDCAPLGPCLRLSHCLITLNSLRPVNSVRGGG